MSRLEGHDGAIWVDGSIVAHASSSWKLVLNGYRLEEKILTPFGATHTIRIDGQLTPVGRRLFRRHTTGWRKPQRAAYPPERHRR